jgi:hypothetical protein
MEGDRGAEFARGVFSAETIVPLGRAPCCIHVLITSVDPAIRQLASVAKLSPYFPVVG